MIFSFSSATLAATRWPLGLSATLLAGPGSAMTAAGLSASGPVAARFHILIVLSAPVEAARAPSALMLIPVTAPSWAVIVLTSLPSAGFQILTALSSPAEMMRSPLGLKAAWRTGPLWRDCQ